MMRCSRLHLVDLVLAEQLLHMRFARGRHAILALHVNITAVRRCVLGLLGWLIESCHVGVGEHVQPALDVLGAYEVITCMPVPEQSPSCTAPSVSPGVQLEPQ